MVSFTESTRRRLLEPPLVGTSDGLPESSAWGRENSGKTAWSFHIRYTWHTESVYVSPHPLQPAWTNIMPMRRRTTQQFSHKTPNTVIDTPQWCYDYSELRRPVQCDALLYSTGRALFLYPTFSFVRSKSNKCSTSPLTSLHKAIVPWENPGHIKGQKTTKE